MSSKFPEPCSHHIFCVGDYCIPYARLSALSLAMHCPAHLLGSLQIYIHVDGLRQDQNQVAEWLDQTPITRVTTGMFGVGPDEYVPARWHQTMINRISQTCADDSLI